MKSSLLLILLMVQLPGYRYEFPRDHFNHPGFQTEWWYYTGNLRAPDGRRFGFELTFFRSSETRPSGSALPMSPVWQPNQLYLAHLALSDINHAEFYHTERLNRAGPGLAGASLEQRRVWNGNWQVRWPSPGNSDQQLQAVCDRFTLLLNLHPAKPPVINGQNGISQKGPQPGAVSHYISFTRLSASGTLNWHGTKFNLDGLAWMDHEFFTQPSNPTLSGWDWFSIQLDNNQELMIYRLRQKSGEPDPYSSGTYVDAKGVAHFLKSSEFSLTPAANWRSALSGATYPLSWEISVPSLGLSLTETTTLKNQELIGKSLISPTYWEGAVTYSGIMQARPVHGLGYLEMTGYSAPLIIGPTQGSTPPPPTAHNAASQPEKQSQSSAAQR
jgi:predicted secreted hydrolase